MCADLALPNETHTVAHDSNNKAKTKWKRKEPAKKHIN